VTSRHDQYESPPATRGQPSASRARRSLLDLPLQLLDAVLGAAPDVRQEEADAEPAGDPGDSTCLATHHEPVEDAECGNDDDGGQLVHNTSTERRKKYRERSPPAGPPTAPNGTVADRAP